MLPKTAEESKMKKINSENSNTSSHQDVIIASNPSTDTGTLKKLSQSTEEYIRAAVALNISTPDEIVTALLNDSSEHVRGCAEKKKEEHNIIYNIHPTAIIHKGANLASNVIIGPYSIIHKNVIIEEDAIFKLLSAVFKSWFCYLFPRVFTFSLLKRVNPELIF